MQGINSVIITGNLTRDPELNHINGGTAVTKLRIAVNGRRKDGQEWVDKPNFFNVTVWGNRGVACSEHLAKGSPVAIQGRLDWHQWETDGGGKRQEVQIVAEQVQFLGSAGQDPASTQEPDAASQGSEPQVVAAGVGGGEDEDIPS
jgi:single-strand DNA-binding protein